jgi:drug/metabolite transporter (DMT)-like permease
VLIGLLTAALAAFAFGVAVVLQAIGARSQPVTPGVDLWLLFRMLRHPAFLLSVMFSLCGFLLHLVALRTLPLFVVQPVIASSVAVTAIVQGIRGHEPLGPHGRWLVVTVCAGLGLVTAAAVSGSAVHPSAGWRATLIVAAGAVGLLGWLAGGVHGPVGTSLLGALSGLGFAVVAISARAMPDLAVGSLVRDPATLSLGVGGIVAFLLYSTALQRGTVITATAAMTVSNTVVPVLVGVLALGDRFRSGWAPAAVLGLALAGTATVLLHDPRSVRARRLPPNGRASAEAGAPHEAGTSTSP